MRLYVISKYENYPVVREAYERLRQEGHTITTDWTTEGAPSTLDMTMTHREISSLAEADLTGVLTAEAVVVFNYPLMAGGFVELGAAIARRRMGRHMDIVVIDAYKEGTPRCIFYWLGDVHHARDLEDACCVLSNLEGS
jgi:hypothetical protein